MAIKSVHIPLPEWTGDGNLLRISGEELHHLTVARIVIGESIEAFDGAGAVWTARIESIEKRALLARVTETRNVQPDPLAPILGLALIRATAFELALEKAVEIGVGRIAPFLAARSNAPPPRKMDRWQRIVVEAAKQSKRFHLPTLDPPARFEEVLAIAAATRVIFVEREGGPLAPAIGGAPALYLIGPEGGWTRDEIDAARARNFSPVTLDTGILRAETAAIVGGALLRYELAKRADSEGITTTESVKSV